jgi:hypothetical protein
MFKKRGRWSGWPSTQIESRVPHYKRHESSPNCPGNDEVMAGLFRISRDFIGLFRDLRATSPVSKCVPARNGAEVSF